MNEPSETSPHPDDSTARTEPDAKIPGPPRTKTGRSPTSNETLESLSADKEAAKEEIGQIKRAKEALKSREEELEGPGQRPEEAHSGSQCVEV